MSSTKTIQPKVELDKTREAMQQLGLDHGAEVLGDLLTRAVRTSSCWGVSPPGAVRIPTRTRSVPTMVAPAGAEIG